MTGGSPQPHRFSRRSFAVGALASAIGLGNQQPANASPKPKSPSLPFLLPTNLPAGFRVTRAKFVPFEADPTWTASYMFYASDTVPLFSDPRFDDGKIRTMIEVAPASSTIAKEMADSNKEFNITYKVGSSPAWVDIAIGSSSIFWVTRSKTVRLTRFGPSISAEELMSFASSIRVNGKNRRPLEVLQPFPGEVRFDGPVANRFGTKYWEIGYERNEYETLNLMGSDSGPVAKEINLHQGLSTVRANGIAVATVRGLPATYRQTGYRINDDQYWRDNFDWVENSTLSMTATLGFKVSKRLGEVLLNSLKVADRATWAQAVAQAPS